MRLASLFMMIAVFFVSGPAIADQRDDCIAKCAAIASPCGVVAYKTADSCKVDANKACAAVQPADKAKCLTSALKTCGEARYRGGSACLAGFKSCHAACGPAPAGQSEFWCETEIGGGARADYRFTFCAGSAGMPADDQGRTCMRKIAASLPGAAGQTCEQVN